MAGRRLKPSIERRGADTRPFKLSGVYEAHVKQLLRFIRSKVGSGPPDPEDIAQQAFANFAGLANPADIDNPGSFLTRTAINLINDHFRAARRRKTEPADHDALEKLILDHDETSPEVVVLGRERFEGVLAAVQTLSRRRRRFLLLHRIEDLSYAEIARRSGVSATLVRSEVAEAVRLCREAVLRIEGE